METATKVSEMATKKATEAKNEMTTVGADNSSVPAHLQGSTRGTRLQGMDSNDFVVPRIKLLQGISPEVEAFENAKAGMFWLNVMDEPLGDAFDFIVLTNRKRYLLLPPIGDDRGVLARADDGKTWNTTGSWDVKLKGMRNPVTWTIDDLDVRRSGLAEFGSSNPDDPDSNPAATLFYEYLVWLPNAGLSSPVLLSLARSQAKKARDLNGKIEFAGDIPMQGLVIRAGVMDDKGAEGPFKNYTFVRNGFADPETFEQAVAMAERFSNITYRGAEEEALAGEDAGPKADSKEF